MEVRMAQVMRIEEEAHQTLRELSEHMKQPMQTVVSLAIEAYRRARMFEEANSAFAMLRNDASAWREEVEERVAWEATLKDNLEQGDDIPRRRVGNSTSVRR